MYKYDNDEPLSVGGWIGTLIVMCIPIVRLVMIFVWGFGNGNTSRKNFAIANLILMLIGIAIFIILMALSGPAIMNMFNEIQSLTTY